MKFEKTHQPCPCGDSSDGYSENTDGSGKCFSCGKFFPSEAPPVAATTFQYISWRGIKASTFSRYNSPFAIDSNGNPVEVGLRYADCVKHRSVQEKKFYLSGEGKNTPGLFGSNIFGKGGKEVIVTEGELDAMSAYQMTGIPAVSIKFGAQNAMKDIKAEFDYLNSFHRVYLCFDNDEHGNKAVDQISPLFSHQKLYIIRLQTHKDANGYLEANDIEDFSVSLKNAKRYTPNNIINTFRDLEEHLEENIGEPLGEFPFRSLQKMTYGLFESDFILIKAQEGIGKTEVIRAIEQHLISTTDHNIAVIHLEEKPNRSIKGFASYVLNKAVHFPDSGVSNKEVMEAYKSLVKRDDRVYFYSHFGSEDPEVVLSTIRFLVVACGCKFVFLDHLHMIISGLEVDDERQKLDYLSTQLKMLAEELKFCLVAISHVNDDGRTRGSRYISKAASLVFKLERNLVAEKEEDRNVTYVTVEKNRFASDTGPAGKLFFTKSNFQVKEIN